MGSGPPSTTTERGAPRRGALRPTGARRAPSFLVATLLLFAVACSQPPVAARSDDRLAADITYAADLDGDGGSESIRIEGSTAALTISDGDTVYHSRDKWRLVEAVLGDTDHDGLLEVVTLLDSDDGRHLGLFAYFGGEYRERLVTSELTPRPLSLRVLPGDLLELTEELPSGQEGTRAVLYRWNGFGFTIMGPATLP